MKITFDSELMENQKHADLMAPGLAFDVLRADDGSALFFSIGTDNVLYLTQEVGGSQSGWTRLDLSSQLAQLHPGANITAHRFAVSQNAQTGAIDLALAITAGGTDFLYLSCGNSTADGAWANRVKWAPIPFDDPLQPMPVLEIDAIYLLQTPQAEYFVVDIVKQPGSALGLIFRYYISPNTGTASGQQWQEHDLSGNLNAGSVRTCLGIRTNDRVAGAYTLGTLLGTEQLLYTPLRNVYNPKHAATPARLNVPSGASAIAAALDTAGASHLFVAGDSALFHFDPAGQQDLASAVQIVANPIIAGVQNLYAASTAGRTTVWGLNQQGELFYVECQAGSEGNASAWSYPVPIMTGVQMIAPFLNPDHDNSVIFAHTDGQNVIQLTQDPVTTHWQQRCILLPGTAPDDVVSYTSLTTHVKVADDTSTTCGDLAVAVTSTSPVSVYLNDVYYRLSPGVAVQTTTDSTGVLTIVQETQAVSGVSYQLQLPATGDTVEVNPLTNALTRLSGIHVASDLDKVIVPNGDGTQRKLLPDSVTGDQKTAVASSVQQLVAIAGNLQANASAASAPASTDAWSVVFGAGTATYTTGTGTLDVTSAIDVAAGDVFNWVKTAYEDASQLVVQVADGAYQFFLQIGEDAFHFVLDCVSSVTHAVELVFNKIGVFFDDLVSWLGFVFEWDDIVRTQKVLVNLFTCYVSSLSGGLDSVKTLLQTDIAQVEGTIDQWAGIPAAPSSIGSMQGSGGMPLQDSPQANWASHHLKSNAMQVSTTASPPQPDPDPPTTLLDELTTLLANEGTACATAYQQIEQVFEQIASLSPTDVIKKLAAIVSDLLLSSAENVVLAGLDIVKALIDGMLELMQAPISIPVISKVFFDKTGLTLNFLDAVCLLAAIPVTVVYKNFVQAAPFPDCAMTTSLIQAKDFVTIQQLCASGANTPRLAASSTGTDTPSEALRVLKISCNLGAAAAAAPLAIIAQCRRDAADEGSGPLPLGVNVLTCALTLPYQSPALPLAIGEEYATWYVAVRDALTLLGIGKALIDNCPYLGSNQVWARDLSPGLDSALNLAKLAANVATVCEKPLDKASDWVGYAAGQCAGLGGTLAAGTVADFWTEFTEPVAQATADKFFKMRQTSVLVYGLLCGATALVLAENQ
jgi:hypothetical protein